MTLLPASLVGQQSFQHKKTHLSNEQHHIPQSNKASHFQHWASNMNVSYDNFFPYFPPHQLMSCMVPKMCFQLESYWYGEEQFLSNTNEVWGDILRRSAQKLWAITGEPCFAFQGAQLRKRPVKIARKQTRLSEIRRYVCMHAVVTERLCFILLLKACSCQHHQELNCDQNDGPP